MMDTMPTPTAPSHPLAWPSTCVLTAQALTPEAMQPYGWMLDLDQAFARQSARAINAGTSRRADLPGTLSLSAAGGEPLATVFRARAQSPVGPWRMLERHCLGTQTFVPIGHGEQGDATARQAVCVLLVALGADTPEAATLRAFVVQPHQAFTLKPGTWHHPLIALRDSDFLVIERRAAQEDCEIHHLQPPVLVRLGGGAA